MGVGGGHERRVQVGPEILVGKVGLELGGGGAATLGPSSGLLWHSGWQPHSLEM